MLEKLLFLLVAFITNTIQFISGWGGTIMAMPFSIRLVGMDFAKPILNMLALIVSLMIVIKHFKEIQWKVVLFIGIFMLIGFGLGYLLDYLIVHDQ